MTLSDAQVYDNFAVHMSYDTPKNFIVHISPCVRCVFYARTHTYQYFLAKLVTGQPQI